MSEAGVFCYWLGLICVSLAAGSASGNGAAVALGIFGTGSLIAAAISLLRSEKGNGV